MTQKVMIQPLVLTLMNRKVKAEKAGLTSVTLCLFLKFFKKINSQFDKQLKNLIPTPSICPFSLNILLFKENLSDHQPCLGN